MLTGVLMLETRFPRLIGDIGNPEGFESPLIYKTVKDASPERVVREKMPQLLDPFIQAGRELVGEGAKLLTTSCGFLVLFQQTLEDVLPVPVITSSLLIVPDLITQYGAGSVGILTISKSSLSEDVLSAANIACGVPIASPPEGSVFVDAILGNQIYFDPTSVRNEIIDAATTLKRQHPELKAIVLECTNMAPFQRDIERVTGLAVYSLNTVLSHHWRVAGN